MPIKFKIFLTGFILFTHYSVAQKLPQKGLASYYGKKFHGKRTASGERFNMNAYTSAHRTLPFNSFVKVTNLSNGKCIVVRVNDRGPFLKARIIDLSKAAAERIDMVKKGVAKVKIELVDSIDTEIDPTRLADCCYGEIGAINSLQGYGFHGKIISPDGEAIDKSLKSIFTQEFINESILKIELESSSLK